MEYDLSELRPEIARDLREQGFKFAEGLPWKKEAALRPIEEIAKRLMTIKAVAAWVCAPESDVPSDRLLAYLERHDLRRFVSKREAPMLATNREEANQEHVGDIGWSFEGAWSLAWILGFGGEDTPSYEGETLAEEIITQVFREFTPGFDTEIDEWIVTLTPREEEIVVALEDVFYCVHNAARSAAFGHPECVPEDFHPVIGCSVVQERRQALTWALSPGVAWDETDVST